jgi:hypothetical protein
VHDALEELGDPVGRLGLEEVARSAATDRGEQILLRPRSGEDDDLAVGRRFAQARQGGEPVEARHQEVEENEIRLCLGSGCDRLVAVRRLAGELEAVRA